jgi:hypothetical protein
LNRSRQPTLTLESCNGIICNRRFLPICARGIDLATRIFISYRRKDGRALAFRLREQLAKALPNTRVWMDVEGRPGTRFPDVIRSEASTCDFFIALIGHFWLDRPTDRHAGVDWVFEEIKAALETGRVIIPVLVDGAPMPDATALPRELQKFVTYGAIELNSNEFYVAVDRLTAVIDAHFPAAGKLRARDFSFFKAKGWNGTKLAAKLEELDYETIGENLTSDDEASPAELGPIFEEFTQTWRILVEPHNEEIVGYWRFVPMNERMYAKAKAGKMLDRELTRKAMEYLAPGSVNNVYIAAMCIKSGYRGGKDRELFVSFLDVLLDLARNDILIGRVCANGLNDSGREMCRAVGLAARMRHKYDGGTVYESSLKAVLTKLRRENKKLMLRYGELLAIYGLPEVVE